MPSHSNNHSYYGLTILLAFLTATMPFAIDTYLPALQQMAHDMDISLHAVELSISTYLLGCVPGTLIGGPLSDRLGRKIIGLSGLALYALSAIGIAYTDDYYTLLILRFLQAFGAGFATVIVSAVVRDLYEREEAARVFTLIGFIMMIAPLLAPVFGASLLSFLGWPSIFIFLGCYAAIIFVLLAKYLPQTRAPNAKLAELSVRKILRDYLSVLQNHTAFAYLLIQVFGGAVLFTFLTQAAFLIIEYWEFSAQQFPLFFTSCVLGMAVCNRLNARLLKKLDSIQLLRISIYIQWSAVSLFLISSIFFPSIWIMMPLLVVLISMLGFVFPNSIANYLHFFPEMSGTANALTSALRYLMGAGIGSLTSFLYTGTPVPMAALTFFCSSMTLLGVWMSKKSDTDY